MSPARLLLSLVMVSVSSAQAQSAVKWADIEKWPDFGTGNWVSSTEPGAGPNGRGLQGGLRGVDEAPLKHELAPRIEAAKKLASVGGASCEPLGVVMLTGSKFFFGKDVIILAGGVGWYNTWRRIYLNRTEHGNPEPTYMGDSIGHWVADTLVVDTVAIRPEAVVVLAVPTPGSVGARIALDSAATHMVERYRLTGPDTLELTKTVENPDVFTKPWTTTTVLRREKGPEFPEAYCWMDREARTE